MEQPVTLPPKVDLRPQCPAVYDQGHLGSCTANAIGAALEYDRLKQGLPDFIPSRLFIYYNERAMEGTISVDAGAYIRDGIKSVEKQGFCHEPIWPYVISNFDDKPPDQAYTDAKKYKAISYFRLNNSNITELKSCLAAGFPFVFGFTVYTSFFKADANRGEVPMPGPERVVGGHAVLAVGYDDVSSRFIVRNSWGARRGDKGYYCMPYQYLTDTELSDDFWTIRSVTAAQLAPNN
jgi:C1A family cysteine protease